MNLEEFFKLVTGMKTATTHAGIKARESDIRVFSTDGEPASIEIIGEGEHGEVHLTFRIDR